MQHELKILNLSIMEDNIAIRLKVFIDSLGLTHSQFADMCGLSRPSLSQLLTGRNKKISDVIVGLIHKAFPQLSVLWLLFGEGNMLVDSEESGVSSSEDVIANGEEIDKLHTGGTEIGQSDVFELNLFNQVNESVIKGANEQKFSNLKGLTNVKKKANISENPCVESDIKAMELMKQIDKMRNNPRKVVQITVYYDDSTFETFIPKR